MFALTSEVLHVLPKLITIERELPQFFVLVGKGLIVVLHFFDFVLQGRYRIDVHLQSVAQSAYLVIVTAFKHVREGPHLALLQVISSQCQCQFLRLPVVVEKLLVLVANVVDQVLVKLRCVRQHLQPLCCHHSSRHQLGPSLLLEIVLLVSKSESPLVEAIAEVGLGVLLSVGEEGQPVLDDFPELDPAAPSIKHLRLQVVVCAVPVLPSRHRPLQELQSLLVCVVIDILDLVTRESFVGHEFA